MLRTCGRTLIGIQSLDRSQGRMPRSVVHRTPVVRVHQAKVPYFVALIDVRHARRSQFKQHLRQAVESAHARNLLLERQKILQERIDGLGGQQRAHEIARCFLILGVWIDP